MIVKKLLLIFLFIYLNGCSSIKGKSKEIVNIDCPTVFFSSENNVYLEGNNDQIDIENIKYKAVLNNYRFAGECFSKSNFKNNYTLDLLILVEPINPSNTDINLPIFVLFYDANNELFDRKYFRIQDNLNFTKEISKYENTEVIGKLNIFTEIEKNINSISIGFVNIN